MAPIQNHLTHRASHRFEAFHRYGIWHPLSWTVLAAALASLTVLDVGRSRAETVTLLNGLQLNGKIRTINSVSENPVDPVHPGSVLGRIIVVDNGLRRLYVPRKAIRAGGLAPDALLNTEIIELRKRVSSTTREVGALGTIITVSKFDEFGNRTCKIRSSKGPVDVLQGITRITPEFVQVETLNTKTGFYWDMRLATSSFRRAQLTAWMLRGLDSKNANDRMRIIALYIQAGRNRDALVELESTIKEFPNLRDAETQRRRLYQRVAQEVLDEIERRQSAGQYEFAYRLLKNFPEEGVAGEILLRVEDLIKDYDLFFDELKQLGELLTQHEGELEQLSEQDVLEGILGEIRKETNINNIDRFADYLRLADDDKLSSAQKMSLAVSGWLLGSGASRRNLAESLSLVKVRDEVNAYLQTTLTDTAERHAILQRLESEEGSTPELLAPLVAHMKPPIPTEFPAEPIIPGMLEITVPDGNNGPPLKYVVQLPPEYDPYRRFPCMVVLHPFGGSPEKQIDWWAGPYSANRRTRLGQATRHGYVVIAPAWTNSGQTEYEHSFREHQAVLKSLRDALRRFSIDTDRVFLSGHSMGGDAAWDIGVAHPDLWAGVIPFVARGERYVRFYRDNAKGIPFYFVGGELDRGWLSDQATRYDRYLKTTGFQTMLSVYRGRGHEPFSEEALVVFEWLNRHRRGTAPVEIDVDTMRPWDNYFWWLELNEFRPDTIALPELWPPKNPKTTSASAHRRVANRFQINTNCGWHSLWLSPDIVDFSERIYVNGRRHDVIPKRETLLEDARTRADRQHPFWAMLELGRKS